MSNKAYIKEIFTSIQGEGPYIGCKQLFIRFTTCNLNCKYCDTDFIHDLKEYTIDALLDEINKETNIHSISLTGGEPLLDSSFLINFLPLTNKKIYLETNGTLDKNLKKIIDYVDIISMDIKLDSSANNGDLFKEHELFLNVAIEHNKEIFMKIVFDEHIRNEEIEKCINLAKQHNILIVLQPKMECNSLNLSEKIITIVFNKFTEKYDNVRLIPQVHKFINVQ